MPLLQEEKLREEWKKTEVSKRIFALEAFAQNHGWAGWQGETIQDYWLKVLAEHHRQWVESVREGIEEKIKEIEEIIVDAEGLTQFPIGSVDLHTTIGGNAGTRRAVKILRTFPILNPEPISSK